MGKLITAIAFLLSFSAFAQMNFCTNDLESYPTRSGGRIKPLYVLATDTIKFITGESKVDDLSATEAFCKLSLKAFGMPLELPVKVRVDHVDVKKILGIKDSEHSIAVNEALTKMSILDTELAKTKENNSYKKEITKVKQRLEAYTAIVEARLWTVPIAKENDIEFISLGEFLTETRIAAVREKSDNPVNFLFAEAKDQFLKVKGDGYLLELRYFKMNLFMWAMMATLIAIAFLVAMKNKWPGAIFTAITIGLQLTAITMRVMISGRGPVTNMYETVMFSGAGALVIACIITLFRKEVAFVIAGLCFNILSLLMMKFANGMLDAGISPLVPVLRDNFWLSTHVTPTTSFVALKFKAKS